VSALIALVWPLIERAQAGVAAVSIARPGELFAQY